MRISQGELDRYRAQVASRQDDARAYVLARLRSEACGLTVSEAREASIGIMRDCLSVYGDKAQALSAEMFDEICEAEGIDADPGEMFDDVIDSSKLAGKVHYYAGKLVDGDWDGYAGSNADLAAYYVHRSALENMARNCYKNGVRYARVGTGRETCGYCFMLSSRGFDYRSEETASAGSHEHCDCIIVPGKKNVTKIDGYDPAAMRNRWESCCDAIGGRKQLSAEWDSLSKKDKSKHKGKQEVARRDDYIRKRIQAECETRSPEWLYRGRAPKVDYTRNKMSNYGRLKIPGDYSKENIVDRGNEWADLWAHHVLSENGFSIEAHGHEDIDLKINGQWWEVKSPSLNDGQSDDGNNLGFIESNLRKGIRQFKKRGLSETRIVFNSKYRSAPDEDIKKELLFRMRQHGVHDVLFVRKDGIAEHLVIKV